MKELEQFIKQYFINNGIPLKINKGRTSSVSLSIYGAAKAGCSYDLLKTFKNKYFIGIPARVRLYTYILQLCNKKYCSNCKKVLNINDFSKNSTNKNGLNGFCKSCLNNENKTYYEINKDIIRNEHKIYYENNKSKHNTRAAKRRSAKLNRTPSWVNFDKIKEFYKNCPEGYHVDHIIPLQGKIISGLHVIENLQYLTSKDNLSKGNKWPNKWANNEH